MGNCVALGFTRPLCVRGNAFPGPDSVDPSGSGPRTSQPLGAQPRVDFLKHQELRTIGGCCNFDILTRRAKEIMSTFGYYPGPIDYWMLVTDWRNGSIAIMLAIGALIVGYAFRTRSPVVPAPTAVLPTHPSPAIADREVAQGDARTNAARAAVHKMGHPERT